MDPLSSISHHPANPCHTTLPFFPCPLQLTTQQRRQLRGLMEQAAGRIAHLTAARALATWQGWLLARRAQAARLQVAVHAWRNAQLRSAFAAWSGRVEEKQEQLRKLRHAAAALLSSRLRSAWAGWREFQVQRLHASARLMAAVQLWQRSQLLKAFR